MNPEMLLIRYGELALKSTSVRTRFESMLIKNIGHALQSKNISCSIEKERGRIYLYTADIQRAFPVVTKIFGITSISPVNKIPATLPALSDYIVHSVSPHYLAQKTFALRVTRTGTHPFTSQEIATKLGELVRTKTNARVDLTDPDIEFCIDIRNKNAYFFTEKHRGPGGLPLGTQGNVVAFIASKESLLAAWFLMRRGCVVTFATFDTSLLESIQRFCSQWFVPPEIFILSKQNLSQQLLEFLRHTKSSALVTGHIMNDSSTLQEITDLKTTLQYPILSPLLTLNKSQIQQKATKVGLSP